MLMTVRSVAEGQEQGGMKRRKGGGRQRVGAERGRYLQTNLITSLQNGITLPSSELLTSPKVSEKEREREIGPLKSAWVGTGRGAAVLKDWRKFEMCHINFSHCSYHTCC